jgi:hypothetical protein
MITACEVHPFDQADDTCRSCKRDHCSSCLVYPYGPRKPPYCVACALEAAGVRRPRRRERAFV